jgi:2-hydroxychromene-2-carboxylate isomerase
VTAPAVRFYFSFRSPFAAIAWHRLRRAPQLEGVPIEPLPVWPAIIFGGHMDNPTDNYFKMAYMFGDAARQAELAGLDARQFRELAKRFPLPHDVDYRREKVGLKLPEERWEMPHTAYLFAERAGLGWTFAEAVFVRRFNLDGCGAADVLDPAVVEEIADQVGLDGRAAVAAHASGEFDDRQRQIVAASERDGVFGVPFFVVEREGTRETFWGNDRIEHLLRALAGADELPVIPKELLREVQPDRR